MVYDMKTHLIDAGHDGSLEELLASGNLPFLVLRREICASKMAKHTGHGDRAISPWLPKGKIKVVVLYILVAGYVTLSPITIAKTSGK